MTKNRIAALLLVVGALGCKGEKKKADEAVPTGTDPSATAPAGGEAASEKGADKPPLPSIGDDPSPVKICARLAAAAAAEGGEAEAKWKAELAPECEKSLADAMTARVEKYSAFAECMRDKDTLTAVMNDCKQLEQ